MAGRIEARLKELGITLPEAPRPAANYVPFVVTGNLVFISGQLPMRDGALAFAGKVPDQVSLEDAQAAARLCGINILSQLRAACGGDLDRVVQGVKVGGFVNAVPGFQQSPLVVNGASDLIGAVLGEAGRHARFAVGAGSLPLGAAVEVEALFEIASGDGR